MSIGAETLAIASIASSVVGTGVSIMGQMQQADAARQAANYQAAVARNNQILANQRAAQIEAEGKAAEQKKRLETQRLIGRQRAVLAGNGVLVDVGSALDITSDTAAFGELDALNTRYNYTNQAYNARRQADNFGSDAAMADFRASNSDATLAVTGTLLSGAGSVADKWYRFDSAGAFGKSDGRNYNNYGNYGATGGGPR
jgi:hydrogenase maturation factor